MARRKIAFVWILFGMMALILLPWTNTPPNEPSVAPSPTVPEDEPAASQPAPTELEDPASLTVAVAMDEASFKQLAEQNLSFRQRHRDITVTLTRVEPDEAYEYFRRASEIDEASDVMLLQSEWVNEFAASGFLLPEDAAPVSKALAEQFDAFTAPVKWNGYTWGVPLDVDPYVLVWNEDLLNEWLGESVTLPLTAEQWQTAFDRSAATYGANAAAGAGDDDGAARSSGPISWLTIDPTDPYALLAWLENRTGARTDELWNNPDAWSEAKPFGEALSFLGARMNGVQLASSPDVAGDKLANGETLVAAMPYSEAARLTSETNRGTARGLLLDASSWKHPYVWTRGTSYVISAGTEAEEAAVTWISAMTDASVQLRNARALGRLPVYRSVYEADARLKSLLAAKPGSQTFPNVAPTAYDPSLPDRMRRLQDMWQTFASGQMTPDDWRTDWKMTLADLERDD